MVITKVPPSFKVHQASLQVTAILPALAIFLVKDLILSNPYKYGDNHKPILRQFEEFLVPRIKVSRVALPGKYI